jgi:hypothetical protein
MWAPSNLAESESYITTDGQSTSLSWNKAPVWGLGPNFYYCHTVAGLLMWGVLSLWREDGSVLLNFCWTSPAKSFWSPSPVELVTILYCHRLETSLFTASCDSQCSGEGIRTRLQTGISQRLSLYSRGKGHIENTYLGCVFTAPLPHTGHGADHIQNTSSVVRIVAWSTENTAPIVAC